MTCILKKVETITVEELNKFLRRLGVYHDLYCKMLDEGAQNE